MSDLFIFRDVQSLEEVKEVTQIYENNRGQQDIFMQCLKDAYKMGYLEWKNDDMRACTRVFVESPYHLLWWGARSSICWSS